MSSKRSGPPGRIRGTAVGVGRGLGWFSVGLGMAEILFPRALARGLGVRGSEGLIAGYGVREITTGVGILTSKDPTPWLWSRVGGDALDLATLAAGIGRSRRPGAMELAIAAVVGVTVVDAVCAWTLQGRSTRSGDVKTWDYSDRSGLPRSPDLMRGAARDFDVPRDMRIPEAMRPYASA